ncbi:MAG TPA: ABC transporter permease [Hanamia sp.]|nr:ABC transporter permease [Hanamia sp.]
MFKNYFTTAWRNLKRNKIYSFINIAGLSMGLACAMLILLYVKDEVSFDRFHKNVQNIYRIVSIQKRNGEVHKDGNTGFLQGPRFKQNVPGIASFVRIQQGTEDIKNGSEIESQDLMYVDSSFFNVFTFPLLYGNKNSCLKEPHSIVVTEDEAIKRFGTKDAIGKFVMVKEDSTFVPYTVTAVAKRVPQNSSIQFNVLIPFKETEADAKDNDNWFNFFLNTFVVLNPNTNLQTVENQMQKFFLADASPTFQNMVKMFGLGDDAKMGTYMLQPFTDMHMNTELPPQNGLLHASNPMYSYILSGIALFVLLIACINFVNLTVARSVKRAKEIGIRKVIGGDRKQLIGQFMGESFLLCAIAFGFALLLTRLILPVFNELSNKALAFSYLIDAKLVVAYVLLFLITGLLAGFYPALVLSGYKPVETLYSRFNIKGKNYLQKSLVVIQFTLASFLIIGTMTIYSQFNFLTHKKLGYDDKNLLVVDANIRNHQEAKSFEEQLEKLKGVTGVSTKNGGSWRTAAKVGSDSTMQFQYETVDENFIPLLKIPLLQGRNFSPDYPSDSTHSVIVNETFVKQAGWKNPIGETVNFFYHNNEIYHVIGVVKDYHFASLGEKIIPQLFTMKNDNRYGSYYIRINPATTTSTLKAIQTTFKQFYPMSPYSYQFKDLQNKQQYAEEAKWKEILMFGAFLTIFISCIGLFGLSVLAAEKRTKEIGIRKVLGASVNNIVTILSTDFLKLVFISLLMAIPLSWLAANKWLNNYPYRITLSWVIFTVGSLLVILIALLTVSFQAVKAAIANPVKSLRTE